MLKKRVLLFAVSIFLILIAGCETTKGACQGAAEGAKKDWESLKKADEKMREVLW